MTDRQKTGLLRGCLVMLALVIVASSNMVISSVAVSAKEFSIGQEIYEDPDDIDEGPESTSEPDTQDEEEAENSKLVDTGQSLYIYAGLGAIVVLIGIISFVIIKRRKKK